MTEIAPSRGEELAKARAELNAAGVELAVLSSLANVTYVTGIEVPVPVGAGAELTYSNWLAVITADAATLIAPRGAAASDRLASAGFSLLEFDGFDGEKPTDPRASYLDALLTAVAGLQPATIGVETRGLPFITGRALSRHFLNAEIIEAEAAIQAARRTKTAREIALLRGSSHLADIAHTTLAELCRDAGRTEFEMFAEISKRVFEAAGHDIPLSGELVTGPRTATVLYPNGPRARTTEPGDAALMDLSGRIDGYWFDCTSTHVIGGVKPAESQIRHGSASRDACEAAMAALKPGAVASDAAEAARAAFARHGLPNAHYAGHQIGVTVNELPRLVPYDQTPIEAGMVLSVEPGAYEGPGGSFGARSEKMVLVTEQGPEVLSTFAWGF